MAPKASSSAEATELRFKFVFSVLKNLETVKPDWEKVAEENGIGYGKNAATKFRGIAKDLGYNYEKNTIRPLGDTEIKTPAAAKSTTSRKRKTKDDGESEAKTPTKRKQSNPVKVKDEEDDTAANADVKDEDEE
ncbi:hypothetical protein LTS15_003619 [Exophiala xenobiotica]|nr:hypothetical protein LTS15_003619 [Exophiala xenobiotica]